jgi:hypothetical protein
MTTSTELLERLERTFGHGNEWIVADCLIRFLTKHTGTSHINLQLVRQLTPDAASGTLDQVILRTLQFLAGDGIALLDTRFEIIDANDHPHHLDPQEVKDALFLEVNPLTGDSDPDVAAKIQMYFAPLPEVIDQLVGSRGQL